MVFSRLVAGLVQNKVAIFGLIELRNVISRKHRNSARLCDVKVAKLVPFF